MRRIIPVMIGAFLGVSVVIGALYVVLEYTSLVADLGPSPEAENAVEAVSTGDDGQQIVATVNGEAITADMVAAEIKISRLNVAEPLPPLTGEDLERAREEAINQLISRHLILQAATRQGFVLDDEFVAKRVDLLFGTYGDEALDAALQQAGATRADVVWWIREIFTVEGFTTDIIMGNAAPEMRQQVYNDWMNMQRGAADIKTYLNGEVQNVAAQIGQAAPDFALITPEGHQISLADYRGRVVLVNFWATWCPSCVAEMPEYEAVYQRHGGGQADFVVLGVNLQESPEHVAQYAAGLGVTFPVLLDQNGDVTTGQYQATGMPASFIVDKQGLIYYRHLGPMSGETLEAKLAELGL